MGGKLGLDLEESCHHKCSINRTKWENDMAKSCVGQDGDVRDSSRGDSRTDMSLGSQKRIVDQGDNSTEPSLFTITGGLGLVESSNYSSELIFCDAVVMVTFTDLASLASKLLPFSSFLLPSQLSSIVSLSSVASEITWRE